MKKILSILMILVLVSGAAFAQVEPVVSGSAKLSWGIDFGAGSNKDYTKNTDARPTHGFYNENNLKVMLPFFKRQAFSGGSANKEADVYADISFKADPGNYATIDNGKLKTNRFQAKAIDWTIKATLHFFKFYMTVYPKPDFSAGKALGWEPINVWDGDMLYWFNPEFTGWGTKIGYAREDIMGLDVGLKLGSNGSWHLKSSDDENSKVRNQKDSKYAIGFDLAMEPVKDYFSFDATVNATIGRLNDKATIKSAADYGYNAGISPDNAGGEKGDSGMVNFGVAFTSKPIEDMEITLGFDGATGLTYDDEKGKKQSTLGWDAGLSVGYKWVEAALYFCGAGTEYQGYNYKDAAKPKNYGANMAAHLAFESKEKEGDATNFLPGLAFHVKLNAYDILATRNNDEIGTETLRKQMFIALNEINTLESAYNQARDTWLKANPSMKESDYQALNSPQWIAYSTAKEVKETYLKSKYATVPLGLNLGVSYKASLSDSMWVKPYANLWGETNHYLMHKDVYSADNSKAISSTYFGLAYNIGVTFQPIEKVELDAKWQHGKVASDTYEGGFNGNYMIAKPVNNQMHNGTFVLSVKLTY